MVWTNFVAFAFLVFILVKSSEYFVDAIARVAKYLGVSEFVIGLTVIAIGTSLPELGSSVMASLAGSTELAVGNIIGSNMANIGLILGMGTVAVSLKTNRRIFLRDCLILLSISSLVFILSLDGSFSFVDGLVLLLLAPLYIGYLLKFRPHIREHLYKLTDYLEISRRFNIMRLGVPEEQLTKDLKKEVYEDFVGKGFDLEEYKKVRNRISIFRKNILKDVAIALGGGVAIYLSASFLIPVAVDIATFFGVSNTVIGASLIAIGTSLPELAVSVTALKRGFGGLFLGNMIGSNIFNMTIVMGLAAMANPLNMLPSTIHFALPFMLILTGLLFIFVRTRWQIKHYEGAILLGMYLLFLYLLITGPPNLFML